MGNGPRTVLIVAGLSLKNLKPRVWDPTSPHYLPDLDAVMVSYADFHRMPARRRAAMEHGLHALLGVPAEIPIFLDNGAFHFLSRDGESPFEDYEAFVAAARPDWYPVPRDYIPSPAMTVDAQREYLHRTMTVNRAYTTDGFVPVIHAGVLIEEYVTAVIADDRIASKGALALGGLVPNLLRTPRALPYDDILSGLLHVRAALPDARLHLFGVGGTATLHLAALLGVDSLDSSGWRNRAARGIVQLPGMGDRMVAELGSWRGRIPSVEEWDLLAACECPACQRDGLDGLRAHRLEGFCNRATHNLWTLLREADLIERHLSRGTYASWYHDHVINGRYHQLIGTLLAKKAADDGSTPNPDTGLSRREVRRRPN